MSNKINTNIPTSPLMSPMSPTAVGGKPRCWACWEPQTDSRNPLIRSCGQCKGSDMKLIHHYCLQSYLTNLILNRCQQVLGVRYPEWPLSLTPAWLFDSWLATGVRRRWFLDETIVQWLVWSIEHYRMATGDSGPDETQTIATSPIKETLNSPLRRRRPSFFEDTTHDGAQVGLLGENNNHQRREPPLHELDARQQQQDDREVAGPQVQQVPPIPPIRERWNRGESIDLRPLGLHCARCLDRYAVYAVPAPTFKVLRSDPVTRLIIGLAVGGIVLFVLLSISLIYNSWMGRRNLFDSPPVSIAGGWLSINVIDFITVAGLLLNFLSFTAVGMIMALVRFAGGNWELICIHKPEVRSCGC